MHKIENVVTEIMETLKIEDIIQATGGKIIFRESDSFAGLSIDSRTIKEGELFIAIKGDRFDGHSFLDNALEKGSGAIVSHFPEIAVKNKTIIHVQDTLKALQDIARYLRLQRGISVVAVTGSNGKTTTKELIASILSTNLKVLKNEGNLNNDIGLPLCLSKITSDDKVAVLEMGASAPGDIETLCKIAFPNYGVLTNIGQAHLEGFKDLKTVRKTKLELLGYVDFAIVNADDVFLMEGISLSGFKGRVIKYGIKNPAEISATDIRLFEKGSNFIIRTKEGLSVEIHSNASGMVNIYNILAASAAGILFDIDTENIKTAVESFQGLPMRLEFKEIKGIRVLSDVYNANPASMKEALNELVRIRKGRAIAVLGDMLELGSYAEEAHKSLGQLMSESPIEIFIAVGQLMSLAAEEFKGNVYVVQSPEEAGRLLRNICQMGDTVLIKGSRGMTMEKVMEEYVL